MEIGESEAASESLCYATPLGLRALCLLSPKVQELSANEGRTRGIASPVFQPLRGTAVWAVLLNPVGVVQRTVRLNPIGVAQRIQNLHDLHSLHGKNNPVGEFVVREAFGGPWFWR